MDTNMMFRYSDFFISTKGTDIPAYVVYTNGSLTPRIPTETYSMPECIEVGDFNNDHLDDLVVTYGDTLTKPLFYMSQGDGTFMQSDLAPAGSERRHIRNSAVIDLNNDGYLDYVGFCAPHGFYEKLLGPSWDFTEPDLILINQQGKGFRMVEGLTEGSHHGGAVGDINQDGLVDVFGVAESVSAAANDDPRVPLLQNPDGSFHKDVQALTGIFRNVQISDLRMNDLNGDGIIDFVLMMSPSNVSVNNTSLGTPMSSSALGTLAWAYGQNGAKFSMLDWRVMGEHWMNEVAWKTYLQSNDQNTGAPPRYSCGPSNVELLDVNADGRLDILQGFYVSAPFSWQTSGFKYFENTGTDFVDRTDEVFPDQSANRDVLNPKGFILGFNLADLDGDGQKDLVVTSKQHERPGSSNTKSVAFFMNRDGVFKPLNVSQLDFSFNGWSGLGMVSTGDFNGDGAPDLASIQNAPEGMRVVTSLNLTPNASKGIGVLVGSASDDFLTKSGAKVLRGLAGDDQLMGGLDLQIAEYYGERSLFTTIRKSAEVWQVHDQQGLEGTDQLIGIERVVFANMAIALDIEGNAGITAKILGAVFGKAAVSNKEYVGIGLDLLDKGMGYDTLAGLALSAAKATTNDQIVTKLWTNVVGSAPSAADKAPFIKMLEDGMAPGALAQMAGDTSLNTTNINLVGLAQTGIEYTPVA